MTGGVAYVISHVDTPERARYVGITSQPVRARRAQHFRDAARGRQTPLAKWIRKHGEAAVLMREVAAHSTRDLLNKLEIELIQSLSTGVKDGGLNVSPGGGSTQGNQNWLGRAHSPESKAKMSESQKASHERRGGVGTETRRKMSESRSRGLASGKIRVAGTPESTAIRVIEMIHRGTSQYDIATSLGIHQATVSLIKTGKRHPDLPRPWVSA